MAKHIRIHQSYRGRALTHWFIESTAFA